MPLTVRSTRLTTATAALLLAMPVAAHAVTFTNSDGITIVDNQAGSPYPSPITVSGVTGEPVGIEVGVSGFSHTFGPDVDMLVRSPSGASVLLMSSQCPGPANALQLTFADGAPSYSDHCVSGTYRPGGGGARVLPGDGGAATDTDLSALAAGEVNGTWRLFVADQVGGDAGSIAAWSLTIRTADGAAVRIPASGTSGVASRYPVEIPGPDPGPGRVITGLSVTLDGLSHSRAEDLDILLADDAGRAVPLMSDACATSMFSGALVFSDTASSSLPSGVSCTAGTYRPANAGAGDTWPAPAPAPSATSLSAFDRRDPRGTWRLYVVDDATGSAGLLTGATVSATTEPARPVFFVADTAFTTEGRTATVRVARLGTPSGPATLDYTTAAGTAEPGTDFAATRGTLVFAPGEWTKRIEVPILADGQTEGEEDFIVRIANPTDDAAIDGPDEAGIVIAASGGTPIASPAPQPPSVVPAPAPATTTPAPKPAVVPCATVTGAAKAACLRRRKAATARAACLVRFPKAGARRAACLRAAAMLALPAARRSV